MTGFQIISDMRPRGDQPEAIAQLVQGLHDGQRITPPEIVRWVRAG